MAQTLTTPYAKILAIDELQYHDLIYIHHQLKVNAKITLEKHDTNVLGDSRYKVCFKGFTLGFVTINDETDQSVLPGSIVSILKNKFLPARQIEIQVIIL